MNNRILSLVESIRTSFWFIPTAMVCATTVLAKIFLAYDTYFKDLTPSFLQFIYETSPESIRSLLTTIASSMMTVTSIAFSITVVALSLASSQFGPRLIRNFMSDKGTQSVLGVFVAIFTYCLLVLQATKSTEELHLIPGMATYFGVLLAFVGVGVLIYFIHHVAHSIQADNVVDHVYCQLQEDIERLFPEKKNHPTQDTFELEGEFQQDLKVNQDGYIQAIDIDQLVKLARQHAVKIEVKVMAGDAVVKGSPMMRLFFENGEDLPDDKDLQETIMIGSKRTPIQDPEFAINQLVEIAVRALSPGVNDPYTAITCVDKLCAMLCMLTHRPFPPIRHEDENGVIRVKTCPFEFSQLANAAFDQIRQYSRDSIAVTIRLLESLALIAHNVKTQNQRKFIQQQRDMIEQACHQISLGSHDEKDIERRLEKIDNVLIKQ